MKTQDTWQDQLRHSVTTIGELQLREWIAPAEAARLERLGRRFRVRITPYYGELIEKARPDCPIRLQAVPALSEEDPSILPEWAVRACRDLYGRDVPWIGDAIGDLANLAAPRLTHRYGNRAILHVSAMCAVYCRFCFRKQHLNQAEEALYSGSMDEAFKRLAANPGIRELILTGGDPLSVPDDAVAALLNRLEGLPTLRVLRIHSRMPVTLPLRFTPELLALLGRKRTFRVHLVSHFNHPRELSVIARERLEALARIGVGLFNQSVILRGINDSVDVLSELFQELYEIGVRPFYLHHPDWTPGTFGFRLSIARGRALMREVRGRVAGPALPHYVLDLPGGYGKASLLEGEGELEKLEEFAPTVVPGFDGKIGGAVYQLRSPWVKVELGPRSLYRYLDLYPEK